MAQDKGLFGYSIGKKIMVALTGLFLIVFLLEHLVGNSLLLLEDPVYFETYSAFMGSLLNIPIRVMEVVLLGSILIHVVRALALQAENAKARPVKYAYDATSKNTKFSSRMMMATGIVMLVFILLHLCSFLIDARMSWFIDENTYDLIDFTGMGHFESLYVKAHLHFGLWWYAAIYVVAMFVIGIHLNHGFQRAFQTMGWNHSKYTPLIKTTGVIFSLIVPLGFALIAVCLYLQTSGII